MTKRSGEVKAERGKAKGILKSEAGGLSERIPSEKSGNPPVENEDKSKIKNKSEIVNPKSEIKEMEVHHHPDVHHKAKPWKEYLLEGMMIFLAVFMGFIAENIREHVADHEREEQYMESLVHDLALDTVAFKAGFPIKEKRIAAIDSVYLFFESNPNARTIPVSIFRNIRRTLWDRIYTRNTGTINQLKNAGGLRLIRKQIVRDSIVTYDFLWERLDYYKQVYYTHQQQGNDMVEKMLNASDLLNYYRVNETGHDVFPLMPASTMIRINTSGLNEYLNFLYRQKFTTIQDEQNYKLLEAKAVRLIGLIKREYKLE